MSELASESRKIGLNNPIIVSPDDGGAKRAEIFSETYGTDFISLKKVRDGVTGAVEIVSDGLDGMGGRDVIIVDDMISTGGSIIKSADFLKNNGCGRIFVACTHAVFVGDAQKRIVESGVEGIISTNTVPNPTSLVDVSKIIADSISL